MIGAIIELIGLGLEIFSVAMISSGSFENFMWIGFVAIPVMFVGAVFLILGLIRPMSKFAARTSAPIQKDYMNYMREETVDTAKEYYKDIASGIREGTDGQETIDLNYSVARVGTELTNYLKEKGFNVTHNTTYHDYPAYNGSYTRSLATVENILSTNPSDIIIDVHRDAVGSRSDYAPTVKIGDTDEAAQIMFVIGTNQGGLWHPNWNQNLKFAVKIQEKAEEMYPRFI